MLVDARVGVLVAIRGGGGSQMRPCCSWVPSEAMDKDNTAQSQNPVQLRIGESCTSNRVDLH